MVNNLEDRLAKYRRGMLAAQLLNSDEDEDKKYILPALYQLAEDLDIDSHEARGLIAGVAKSNESLQETINIYASKYQEELFGATIDELSETYKEDIEDYIKLEKDKLNKDEVGDSSKYEKIEEGYKKIKEDFKKYKDKKFKDIYKKVKDAQFVLKHFQKGDYSQFSEDDVKDAQKDLEKYKGIYQVLKTVEDQKVEELRPTEEYAQQIMGDIAQSYTKEE